MQRVRLGLAWARSRVLLVARASAGVAGFAGVLGCTSPGDGVEETAGACEYYDTLYVSEEGISLLSGSCGTLRLRDPEILGEGVFELEWYTDGATTLPVVRALTPDAVLYGLRLRGEIDLFGASALRVRGLPSHSGTTEPEVRSGLTGGGWFERPGEASLVVGAVTARTSAFQVSVTPGGFLEAEWSLGRGGRALVEGESFYLDPVAGAFGPDASELWQVYVDRVAQSSGAPAELAPSASGWVGDMPSFETWDEVFAPLASYAKTREERQVVVLTAARDGAPWDVGSLADALEAGLDDLIVREKQRQVTVGLRWSPFSVASEAAVGEGWVLDANGATLATDGMAFVDVTHAAGRERLEAAAAVLADTGVEWVELDRLWAASVDGVRARSISPQEAFGEALRLVRDRLPGVSLVGVEAPILESSGHVDGLRLTTMPPRSASAQRVSLGPTHGVLWSVMTSAIGTDTPSGWASAEGAFVSWASLPGGLWRWGFDTTGYDPKYEAWQNDAEVSRPRGYREGARADGTVIVDGDGFVAYLNPTADAATFPSAQGEEYCSGASPEASGEEVDSLEGELWVVSESESR